MKYLLFFLCVVILKYMFYREGLYNKGKISGGYRPYINNIIDEGRTMTDLKNKANEVNPNILDRQRLAININDIPLFHK